MKITKEDKKLFKETHAKWVQKESILGKLFLRGVVSSLKNNKDIQSSIQKADKAIDNARTKIEKEAGGNKELIKKSLSPQVRKALGFDY
jgi:heterodisulfide reductase subunit A-like polyferredoxin